MSQFSQKYYKHYIIKDDDQEVILSFWQRVPVLHSIIFLLSLLLILLLFYFCTKCDCLHLSTTQKPKYVQVVTTTKSSQKVQTQEKNETLEETTNELMPLTLEEKIPKQILPEFSKLLPKEEVTLQEYMYFVNDTKSAYPKYVDKETNRMIKEYRPSCKKLDCPVSGISKQDKQAYLNWLNTMSNKKYKLQETEKGFKVQER